MNACPRGIGKPCRVAWLTLLCVFALSTAQAQPPLREFVIDMNLWDAYSHQEIADIFAAGLERNDAESKALALAGSYRLALIAPDVIRSTIGLDTLQAHFSHSDSDVAKNAMLAFQMLAPDDAAAEAALVAHARSGDGVLEDWEYIRYLRPQGITSAAAQDWLLSLASGPISETQFSAAEALVGGMETPPEPLLAIVMALIRSPEYFCHSSLTQRVPRFGAAADPYLAELRELRVILQNRIGTAADRRPSGQILRAHDLEMLERAIAALAD